MEAADLTVRINGDASGLLSAVSAANESIGLLKTNADAAFAALSDKAVTINAVDNTAAGIASARTALDSLQSKTVTVTVNYKTGSSAFAKGTLNAPSGLAMVNDDGSADPRELIVDRGRAFIPEGENVLLPLSRGARVYTSSQTRALMARMGIKSYASGKSNSDEFTAAYDDWNHYTRTHAVTTSEELEKWVEFSAQFKSNAEDIAEIEEQIYSLTVQYADELNDVSREYISLHTALNDWSGDDPISAYQRVYDRNYADMQAGLTTWEEFTDTMSDIGEDMYDERIEQSEKWLKHEQNYNDLSTEDTIAAYGRMADYTTEYYNQGIIDYQKFSDAMLEISEKRMDAEKDLMDEMYSDWETSAENWYEQRSTYGDWADYGDSEVQYYQRCIERVQEFYNQGIIEWQEYCDKTMEYSMKLYDAQVDAASDVYSSWQKSAENWYNLRDTYNDWEAYGDSEVDYYQRCIERVQEFYDQGILTWQEYCDETMEYSLKLYKAQEDVLDDMLQEQADYISELKEQFSEEEQALQESWEVEDRARDIADVKAEMALYENAVTSKGQEKYQDLQDELESLEREEELYELEQEHQEVLEELQAEYEEAEANKQKTLWAIRDYSIDITDICDNIEASSEDYQAQALTLMEQIIEAIAKVSVNIYNDNSTLNTTNATTAASRSYTIAAGYYG